MSTNYHYEWTDSSTLYKPTSMNPAMADLDKAVSYAKNIFVHHDGTVKYSIVTGLLVWSSTIRVLFNREDGKIIQNIIAAGSIQVADNEVVYVDLNETNDTALTMAVMAINYASSSVIVAYNRFVLGYKNPATDRLLSLWLDINPDKQTQEV